ncbi:hypothetical protein V525_07490 [Gordonia alkanivorans CGMCC 6845]|uniref:Uncharacterized protein n=1 Tax=Gordonia alkanivorans CGMCC 6845 TaxID=1423140 RepID=W9DDI0_9ACTN|nr:hypothetical protein V525_07490 [Gordonia alkanivorans CGMCC 6845]
MNLIVLFRSDDPFDRLDELIEEYLTALRVRLREGDWASAGRDGHDVERVLLAASARQ